MLLGHEGGPIATRRFEAAAHAPTPLGRHIPELEGARSANESSTNNLIRRTGKRKTHYELA